MRSPLFSTARPAFVIFVALLLALALRIQPARAQTFKVLHVFHGPNGALPEGRLTRDAAGNFYGTTGSGGKFVCKVGTQRGGCGAAFKLDRTGKQLWLHSFHIANGTEPLAGLLPDEAGNLYGTTRVGGDTKCVPPYGCGTVFRLDQAGRASVLHKFSGFDSGTDGGMPAWGPLVEDPQGNLYGTTAHGGTYGYGTVFELEQKAKETVLYSFGGGSDGVDPSAGVIRDATGNLYGVTGAGGGYGNGTAFELGSNGMKTLLHDFSGRADGEGPASALLLDSAGNLYGTTSGGGNYQGVCGGLGCGVVFELSQSGGNWTETTLLTFNGSDGQFPYAGPLVMDSRGNLYGTTNSGGAAGWGLVFKLDKYGKETVLHSFTDGADGGSPWAGLIMDKAGNLYGTTLQGGDLKCARGNGQGCGVVFKLKP